MPRSGYDSPEDLLAFVKSVANQLSELGFGEAAADLNEWSSTAYTTSSELLGELGLVCRRVLQRDGARIPAGLKKDLKSCQAAARDALRWR